jgi:hypothetical protein
MTQLADLGSISDLLDELAGPGEGLRILEQLNCSFASPVALSRDIARSATFALRYKEARTCYVAPAGRKEADGAFVGIPDLDHALSFDEQFQTYFRPRLAARADSFAVLFAALGERRRSPLVIETGCLRVPGNWTGDGQSSFLFDAWTRDNGGRFFSIDLLPESIETARRACSSVTNLICNDSVASLHAMSGLLPEPATLIYLDSYDVDPMEPMPSAIHHALELTAAWPLIGPGTLVCVDDYGIGTQQGGKGFIIDNFFHSIRAETLYSGYQKLWRVS